MQDETEETQKNSLQDPGKASEGSEGTTPPGEAKTQYTQEELDKALQADRIKRGRDDKTLSTREATVASQEESVKAGLARIEEWERQQDAADLAEAQKDPAKMRAYQANKAERNRVKGLDEREAAVVKREAEATRREAEGDSKVKAAEEVTLGMKLYEIAARYNLNPEELKKDVKDFNLTTVEQAEALAKRLSTTGERPPGGGGEGEEKPTAPITVPTTGGSPGTLTPEQFEKLPAAEKKKYLEKQ